MENSFSRIYSVVRSIPFGRVASYGQIARLAGNPHWARVVGYAMRACADESVPCHRVVHRDGSLSAVFGVGGSDWQRALLVREGVRFQLDGKVAPEAFARFDAETE